jgi:acyl-CoA reductase-like NAD-dependent aldehyde dehydrogenase
MSIPDFGPILVRHRKYFLSGKTRPVAWREAQLVALERMMTERADDFAKALWTDLRKNRIDAEITDIKFVANDAAYSRKHLRRWLNPQKVGTPMMLAPAHTRVRFDPLGVGLIIGAWNYPLMLTLSPLVAAIAGGNAAVIKPSEVSPATADALAKFVPEYLDKEAFTVVQGAVPETTALLEQRWDHIFFTGGPPIGKIVMAAAAKHLTPVVLELGGKSPTIVHSSANLKVTARRIAHGRWANAGQTCTAPDYLLVFKDVMTSFLEELKNTVIGFYGPNAQLSPDYGRIVNTHHFDRLLPLLRCGKLYQGGRVDREERFIEPTILLNPGLDSPVMQEEIFGPILPVLEVESAEHVISFINERPQPLGLYVFAEDRAIADQILDGTGSGDAAVNDCTLQPIIPELPFGGVGNSGMGKYHGEWGFRAYTNARGVLYHSTKVDLAVRYPPYSENQKLRGLVTRHLM